MNKEYNDNQKKQRKAFKKYRKYIGKILLWGGISVVSTFVLPWNGLLNLLNPILGNYIAGSVTFFSQWLLTGAGVLGAVTNAIKANRERKRIDDSQDEEENIIDGMVNENDELKRKVENLEKSKSKTIDKEERYTKTYDDKEKELHTIEKEENDEKGKKYVK